MKVDIQFVNFPKSDLIREIVSNRIKECFDKFSTHATSIKVFFSVDGFEHHVKIAVNSAHLSTCINASATNLGVSIEKAINKLESFLRRSSAKQKHKKNNFLAFSKNQEITHFGKRNNRWHNENIFDKYEDYYKENFDYI